MVKMVSEGSKMGNFWSKRVISGKKWSKIILFGKKGSKRVTSGQKGSFWVEIVFLGPKESF